MSTVKQYLGLDGQIIPKELIHYPYELLKNGDIILGEEGDELIYVEEYKGYVICMATKKQYVANPDQIWHKRVAPPRNTDYPGIGGEEFKMILTPKDMPQRTILSIDICGLSVKIKLNDKTVITAEVPDYKTRQELEDSLAEVLRKYGVKKIDLLDNPLRAGRDLNTQGI